MATILEIITQIQDEKLLDENLVDAVLDGKKYKKYGDGANLFRILLAPLYLDTFSGSLGQSIVPLMFTKLKETEEKELKKLQTTFNKLQKAVKNGKAPKVAEKKAFYTSVFKLILPLLDPKKFKTKASTLINSFSSSSATAKANQNKSIIGIGKALLVSPVVDISSKDKMLIKGVLSDLGDTVEGDEELNTTSTNTNELDTDNSDEIVSKNIVDEKISVDTPIEEVKEISEKTQEVTNMIETDKVVFKNKSDQIRNTLETATDSEYFHIVDDSMPADVAAIVNEKIDILYTKAVKNLGQKEANFVGQFVQDSIKNLNTAKNGGYLNHVKASLTMDIVPVGDDFSEGYTISMGAGKGIFVDDYGRDNEEEIFMMDRMISTSSSGRKMVDNHQLRIPLHLQSSGLNKKLFKDALELYKADDVEKIYLNANVDVGGYAWFRYGFIPDDSEQIDGIADWIATTVLALYGSAQYDKLNLPPVFLKNTVNKVPEITNFIELFKQGQSPDLQAVVNKFSKSFSTEFSKNYSNPKDFKKIQEDIAVNNFKPVTHKGKKYTMSCKQVLNLQAAKDEDGFSMISIKNDLASMSWYGTLMMDDLEATHAYLNGKA